MGVSEIFLQPVMDDRKNIRRWIFSPSKKKKNLVKDAKIFFVEVNLFFIVRK